jgi:hypothetical protein
MRLGGWKRAATLPPERPFDRRPAADSPADAPSRLERSPYSRLDWRETCSVDEIHRVSDTTRFRSKRTPCGPSSPYSESRSPL